MLASKWNKTLNKTYRNIDCYVDALLHFDWQSLPFYMFFFLCIYRFCKRVWELEHFYLFIGLAVENRSQLGRHTIFLVQFLDIFHVVNIGEITYVFAIIEDIPLRLQKFKSFFEPKLFIHHSTATCSDLILSSDKEC